MPSNRRVQAQGSSNSIPVVIPTPINPNIPLDRYYRSAKLLLQQVDRQPESVAVARPDSTGATAKLSTED